MPVEPARTAGRALLRAEDDDGFRELVAESTRRGLRVAGVVWLALIVVYVVAYLATGRGISFAWAAGQRVVVWDKLVMAAAAAALAWVSGTGAGGRRGRELGCAAVLLAAAASVTDDLLNGDVTFTSAWLVLFLLAAAGTLPLKPAQVAALSATLLVGLAVALSVAPADVSGGSARTQTVFFTTAATMICVASVVLYAARYQLYLAGKRNRQLADELAREADRLQRVETLKSRFFSGITHDIRTPLSLVLGPVSDALAHHSDELPAPAREGLALARRSGEQLRTLIDDLLDLGHLDSGSLRLRAAPHDLGEAVRTYVTDLYPLAERHGVGLELGSESGLVAEFDPDRLRQVVANVAINAIRHSPRSGTVRVQVGREASDLAICVSDEGPGVPEDLLPLLFDRFQRGGDGQTRGGFGLGLAIAREFTELHGGRIAASNRPAGGLEVVITLPASAWPARPIGRALSPDPGTEWAVPSVSGEPVSVEAGVRADATPAADTKPGTDPDSGEAPDVVEAVTTGTTLARDSGGGGGLPTVLVADDHPDMRAYLRMHLAARYRLLEAENGAEALRLARSEHPDLVLTDIRMPVLDGVALCRALRAEEATRATPVVLITASGDHATLVEGLAAGADDFLTKPFDAEALLARMENLIELRRMLRSGAPFGSVPVGPSPVHVASSDAEFVERAKRIIEEHLANSNFGVDWLADEVGLSTRQLQRRMRDATRLSAAGFIRMLRLGRAAGLLTAGAANVAEAADAVGFRDPDHFSQLFRQAYGVPPSDFARRARRP